jgi:response regulator NasT
MNRSLRIVVAEDGGGMGNWFQRILSLQGHQVLAVVHSGRELVRQALALTPDLILAEVGLADLDAIEAAEQVCRDRPVPVVLVSAGLDADLVQRSGTRYVMAHVRKPIDPADVETAIALAVRRFEQFEELRREAADLRRDLEDRKLIERAKGVVMKRLGLDEPEAYRRLRKLANDQNRKLSEVAQMVLEADQPFQQLDGH